jgi:sentrin-specific protease 8
MLIAFYYEWLAKDLDPRVLLMDPSAVFMMQFEDDIEDLRSSLFRLNLTRREVIFCPINDNDDPQAVAGGSHWTLLVYCQGSCYFYDSGSATGVPYAAQTVASRLHALKHTADIPVTQVKLLHPQTNSFDCGAYVLLLTELLAKSWESCTFALDSLEVTPAAASSMREKVREAVDRILRLNVSL